MTFKRRVFVAGLVGLLALACSHGRLKGEVFEKGNVRYHVAPLDLAHWKQVKVSESDLVFVSRQGNFLISLNAVCKEYGDPPLEVLMQHLLMGFTEREKLASERWMVDGREGLRARYVAKMDGVARELDLFVLKKDGCVFDLSYVAPVGEGEVWRSEFSRLVSEFRVRFQ